MIHEINIVLLFIAFIFTITLFDKKEGFTLFPIDPHKKDGYIPYVPQDVMCMIMDSAGIQIDRYGIMKDKCQNATTKLKKDDSNICRI